MLDLLTMINLERVYNILETFATSFLSIQTLAVLICISTLGGITFLADDLFIKAYHRFLDSKTDVVLDMDETRPQPKIGDRKVSLSQCNEDRVYPYIDSKTPLTRGIMYLQWVITAPLSILYVPLTYYWSKKVYTDEKLEYGYMRLIQNRRQRGIIITLSQTVWVIILMTITLFVLTALVSTGVALFLV